MHLHLEIIMPPTDDVSGAVDKILKPFDENLSKRSKLYNGHPFFDYYEIGGRWTGEHARCAIDPDRMTAFIAELNKRGVTVSGLQFGKQELSPASQIEAVDALWREWFPGVSDQCLIFKHAKSPADVCRVDQIHQNLSADRVIIAADKTGLWDGARLEAGTMLQTQFWNGVQWSDTAFSGKVLDAINHHAEKTKNYSEDYKARATVMPDWLCVTVDYHT